MASAILWSGALSTSFRLPRKRLLQARRNDVEFHEVVEGVVSDSIHLPSRAVHDVVLIAVFAVPENDDVPCLYQGTHRLERL